MRLQALRELVTTKEAKSLPGMIVPRGTTLHVMKETPPPPVGASKKLRRKILVVRVDNGTGHLDLMPETAVYEEEVTEA